MVKEEALFFLTSLFILGWSKLMSTLGMNGICSEAVTKSTVAQMALFLNITPTVWLRFQLPEAILLKRFHNDFQESMWSLYFIPRKRKNTFVSYFNSNMCSTSWRLPKIHSPVISWTLFLIATLF
jgi:hypothetical protein